MPYKDPEKRKEHGKRYYAENKETLLEYRTQWAKDNPESRRESSNRYASSDRERQRFSKLKSRYGITKEKFFELLEAQNHKCAGCLTEFTDRQPDVDHCHSTGEVRGLLCNNCNRGLGHLKENVDTFNRLIVYLQK